MDNPSPDPEPEQLKTPQIERSFTPSKVIERGPPFTPEEFLRARSSLGLNMALSFFGGIFAVLGVALAFVPNQSIGDRFIGGTLAIVGGSIAWFFGRRSARQARFLACPGCKDLLSSQTGFVLRTGACRKCGAVVLSGHTSMERLPHEISRGQTSAISSRTFTRSPSASSQRIKAHPERLTDIAVLFAAPAVFMLISNGLEFGQAWTIVAGLMLIGYGAIFYFFPDPARHQSYSHSSHPSQIHAIGSESSPPEPTRGVSPKTPWFDYTALLLLPITVVVGLLYLVWTHTVLGKLVLGVATIAIPLAVVLLSWFVIKHEAHQVKKTGKPAPGMLMGGLLAFWLAAVFIFVVCLVTWVQKFAR